MSSGKIQDTATFSTPNKKDNEVFQSRFFTHSEKKVDNPEVVQTFFNNSPFQKFYRDISILRPISYQCPNNRLLERNYVVVEEKVTYGRPLNEKEMEQLRLRRKADPEIVTWGSGEIKDRSVRVSSLVREQRVSGLVRDERVSSIVQDEGVTLRRGVLVEQQAEQKDSSWCCAAGENKNNKDTLVNSI